MTDKNTLLQQALDALELACYGQHPPPPEAMSAMKSLRAEIARPQEAPVAWTTMPDANVWDFVSGADDPNGRMDDKWFPLYTTPQAQPPLTDAQIIKTMQEFNHRYTWMWSDHIAFARAIERAHGITALEKP